MIDINKPSEGVDYIIKPLPEVDNSQAWIVEVKTGPFKGYDLLFTHMHYNGKTKSLRFQLDAVNQDESKVTPELEDYGFQILQDIIKTGLANGSVVLNDKDSNN